MTFRVFLSAHSLLSHLTPGVIESLSHIVNVLHIAKTNIYDCAANASAALDIMEATYSGDTWHYTDPVTGEKPDIHHAILFREAIVGIAFVGTLCNSKRGYGVTGGMKGTLSKIDGTMFWCVHRYIVVTIHINIGSQPHFFDHKGT